MESGMVRITAADRWDAVALLDTFRDTSGCMVKRNGHFDVFVGSERRPAPEEEELRRRLERWLVGRSRAAAELELGDGRRVEIRVGD